MGTTYILAAALAFTGVLPFSVLTSVIVAYGMAGEMVKLAETNMLSELQLLSGGGQEQRLPGPAQLGSVQLIERGGRIGSCSAWMQRCLPCLGRFNRQMCAPSQPLDCNPLPCPIHCLQTPMASRRSSSWPPSGTLPSAPCSCSACCCPRSCDGRKLSARAAAWPLLLRHTPAVQHPWCKAWHGASSGRLNPVEGRLGGML